MQGFGVLRRGRSDVTDRGEGLRFVFEAFLSSFGSLAVKAGWTFMLTWSIVRSGSSTSWKFPKQFNALFAAKPLKS